jgi:hypothetical protein
VNETKDTTRQAKVQALIDSGAIRLFPGRGYAEVVGSRGTVYQITKQQGCNCLNGMSRDPRSCYHAAATRLLCEEYRLLAKQTRRGETIRPSVGLLKAIGWGVGEQSSAPIPAGALVDDRGIPYCAKCGSDIIDGRCSREAEADAKREDDLLARRAEAFEMVA